MPILKIEHLKKYYGKDPQTTVKALDDVSLSVEKGEFLAIVGTSGSGKAPCFICSAAWTGPLKAR